MYSGASVTHLAQSIERASHHASDSVGTQSIAFSSHSSASSACKAAADPVALFGRALEDLKGAALTASKGPQHDTQEYFDSWAYWKKHPSVLANFNLFGQLLIEHLLVLANWKEQLGFDFKTVLFEDLCGWLQATAAISEDSVEDLREQLCTGFFCVYLQDDAASARKLLLQARPLLPQEMFLSLGSQLKLQSSASSSSSANNFVVRIQVIFGKILEFFKTKLAKLFEFLQKQPALFLAFCTKLVNLIVQKIQ